MTAVEWFGLGWAVFLGLWFLLWVLGYHETPTPTQEWTTPNVTPSPALDPLLYRGAKGFAKNVRPFPARGQTGVLPSQGSTATNRNEVMR